jgi:hypothetical protein
MEFKLNWTERDTSNNLDQIIKWWKGSGLKVNQTKIKICIIHNNSCLVSSIMVDGLFVQTSDSINDLGVDFNSKLRWSKHISKTIKRNKNKNKSIHAIKLNKII